MKYGNQQYDGGSPLKVGDRYYAFDHVRDWWYQMDQIGHVAMQSFGGQRDVIVYGGDVTEGSTASYIDISETVAYCQYVATIPSNAAVPPASESVTISGVRVALPAQTDLLISGTATLDGVTTNYVKLAYTEVDEWSRARAIAAGTYVFAVSGGWSLTVDAVAPVAGECVIAELVGDGTTLTITVGAGVPDRVFVEAVT